MEVPRRSPGRGPPYWKSRVLRRQALGDEDDAQGRWDRTDVPFRVTTRTSQAVGGGPVPTRLHLELLPVAGRGERRLKLLIEARPLEQSELVHDGAILTVPPSEAAQAVERELRPVPGIWQARVVLTDDETGAVGSAQHTFVVPGRAGS
jgi:hypothetical protein